MSAIYHIIKPSGVTNGNSEVALSVSAQTSTGYLDGYHGGYNDFLPAREKGNPPANSPLPSGNWRGSGTKIGHIK